jgi:hypothetical protein
MLRKPLYVDAAERYTQQYPGYPDNGYDTEDQTGVDKYVCQYTTRWIL